MKEVIKPPPWGKLLTGRLEEWQLARYGPRTYIAESLEDMLTNGQNLPYTDKQRRLSHRAVAIVLIEKITITSGINQKSEGWTFHLSDTSNVLPVAASWPNQEDHGWIYRDGKWYSWVAILWFFEEGEIVIQHASNDDFLKNHDRSPPRGDNNPGFI